MVKITELPPLLGDDSRFNDLFVTVSTINQIPETKNITIIEVIQALQRADFDNIRITGGYVNPDRLIVKNTDEAGFVPTPDDLARGELFLNYATGFVYYKDNNNAIQFFGGSSGGDIPPFTYEDYFGNPSADGSVLRSNIDGERYWTPIDFFEENLGNPGSNGQVLSSEIDGTRSWIDLGTFLADPGVPGGDNYVLTKNVNGDIFWAESSGGGEDLGNPDTNGEVLHSQADGTRYWAPAVEPGIFEEGLGNPAVDDQVLHSKANGDRYWATIDTTPPVNPTPIAYYISAFVPEKLNEDEIAFSMVAPRNLRILSGMTNCIFRITNSADVPASGDGIIEIRRNGTLIGSITFAEGTANGTATFATNINLNTGDVVNFINKYSNTNEGFKNISYTIYAETI